MARKPLRRAWTPEDTALLANLLRVGKGYGQIARKMNRCPRVLRFYANRLEQSEPRRHEQASPARADALGTVDDVSHLEQAACSDPARGRSANCRRSFSPLKFGGLFAMLRKWANGFS